MTAAPWLDHALADLGTAEVPGGQHNPAVLAYFADAGRPDIRDDETAWCAAATGSWLKRAGMPIPPPNLALLARSYERYGVECDPKPGAIGVWPRGSADWQGHVGLVIAVDQTRGVVRRISGNQGNAVRIDEAPIDTALAFRWPVAPTVTALRRAGSTEIKAADVIEIAGVGGAAAAVGGVAAVEAIKAPPEAVTSQPPAPVIDPEALTALEQLGAVLKALGGVMAAHPWLVGCLLACILLLALGRRIKARRVARAKAGAPLSVEVLS